MEDRELLEQAARAANIRLQGWSYSEGVFWTHSGLHDDRCKQWSPLHDDGDALRLAVKLKITPHIDGNLTDAESTAGFFTETHYSDPYAATRRAIVRAAAAIQQSKEAA